MKLVRNSTAIDHRGVTHIIQWEGERTPYGWYRRCDKYWLTTDRKHFGLADHAPTCVRCVVTA